MLLVDDVLFEIKNQKFSYLAKIQKNIFKTYDRKDYSIEIFVSDSIMRIQIYRRIK